MWQFIRHSSNGRKWRESVQSLKIFLGTPFAVGNYIHLVMCHCTTWFDWLLNWCGVCVYRGQVRLVHGSGATGLQLVQSYSDSDEDSDGAWEGRLGDRYNPPGNLLLTLSVSGMKVENCIPACNAPNDQFGIPCLELAVVPFKESCVWPHPKLNVTQQIKTFSNIYFTVMLIGMCWKVAVNSLLTHLGDAPYFSPDDTWWINSVMSQCLIWRACNTPTGPYFSEKSLFVKQFASHSNSCPLLWKHSYPTKASK